jgi:hypothetical protein
MMSRETVTQPDGAVWEYYDLEQGHLVITGRGRELARNNPGVFSDIQQYRQAVMRRGDARFKPNTREHFASGGNSDVYSMGGPLAVKEATNSQSLLFALERMDRLHNVMEKGVPRWIDMPAHYGMLIGKHLSRQYMLMEKIDTGVTVEHVLSNGGTTEIQRQKVRERFSNLTDDQRTTISAGFDRAGDILHSALEAESLDPKQYMPDWHEGNVLLEPLPVPVGDSHFKYWVIDQ